MSALTEWFEGRSVEEDGAGVVILPMPFWALLVIAVIVCLPGCATPQKDVKRSAFYTLSGGPKMVCRW